MSEQAGHEFWTIDEVADYLRCHKRTIQRRIKEGVFTVYRIPGHRRYLLKRKEVIEALEVTAEIRQWEEENGWDE